MSPISAESRTVGRGDRLATFLLVALMVLFIFAAILFRVPVSMQSWPTSTAHISQIRIVAVAAEEHPFQGGTVLYRVEAHVTYELKGKRVERWVPASMMKRDKDYLESWLSQKKQDSCLIRWNPKNPDDVEAVLINNGN